MERKVIILQPRYNPVNPKRAEDKEQHGFDIYRVPILRQILLYRHSRTVFQSILLVIAIALVYDGFFGRPESPRNLATVVSWIDYRFLLVVSLFLLGNLFCMACPFVLVSHNIQKRIGLNRVWPNWLKGKWIALSLLLLLFYSYEQWSLWDVPALTATLILLYFGGAVITDFVFKGNSFCKYVCPLGLFNQTYAMIAPTHLTSKSFSFCKSCTTKECIKGNPATHQEGCQMSLYMGTKQSNMDCTYQMNCAKACPYNNVGFEFRNPLRELWTNLAKRDFSLAAVVMVLSFLSLTNAGSMIGAYQDARRAISNLTGIQDSFWDFTIIFVIGTIALPALFGWLASWFTQKLVGTDEPLSMIFKRYALGLIPLSLAIWFAHYLFHFSIGGAGVWPTIQNFFARLNLPIFGEPQWATSPILPYSFLFPLQLIAIYGGFLASTVTMYQISRKMYKKKVAVQAMLAFVGLALLIAIVATLIMSQPMQPRGA